MMCEEIISSIIGGGWTDGGAQQVERFHLDKKREGNEKERKGKEVVLFMEEHTSETTDSFCT